MSDSIEIAKRYYDIMPTLEFDSVSEVLNVGMSSSMRKAYRPDSLVLSMANDLEQLQKDNKAKQEVIDKLVEALLAYERNAIFSGLPDYELKLIQAGHEALNSIGVDK